MPKAHQSVSRSRVHLEGSWRLSWQYDVVLDFSLPGKPTDNVFAGSFNGRVRGGRLNANWFLRLADAGMNLSVVARLLPCPPVQIPRQPNSGGANFLTQRRLACAEVKSAGLSYNERTKDGPGSRQLSNCNQHGPIRGGVQSGQKLTHIELPVFSLRSYPIRTFKFLASHHGFRQ